MTLVNIIRSTDEKNVWERNVYPDEEHKEIFRTEATGELIAILPKVYAL